jgi:hypothetical protein
MVGARTTNRRSQAWHLELGCVVPLSHLLAPRLDPVFMVREIWGRDPTATILHLDRTGNIVCPICEIRLLPYDSTGTTR